MCRTKIKCLAVHHCVQTQSHSDGDGCLLIAYIFKFFVHFRSVIVRVRTVNPDVVLYKRSITRSKNCSNSEVKLSTWSTRLKRKCCEFLDYSYVPQQYLPMCILIQQISFAQISLLVSIILVPIDPAVHVVNYYLTVANHTVQQRLFGLPKVRNPTFREIFNTLFS